MKPKPPPPDALLEQALALSEAIAPLLAGHHPAVQGGALAGLLGAWLWGHQVKDSPTETAALREEMLEMHIAMVRRLVVVTDH